MHSTASGVGSVAVLQATADDHKMLHNNEDDVNKFPMKSTNCLENEEINDATLLSDPEFRPDQKPAILLAWMKKLTILLICFIGISLISYVVISLCFNGTSKTNTTNNATSYTDSNYKKNATFNKDVINEISNPKSTANLQDGVTKNSSEIPQMTINNKIVSAAVLKPQVQHGISTFHNTDCISNDRAGHDSELGVYKQAAVASDQKLCSQIGSNLLAQNGTAVDAAIGTLLCNGLITMQSMGIGGGVLMNIYSRKNEQAFSIDARDVAPFAAEPGMFDRNPKAAINGPLSITVPGELMGYHRAHERFGKLPWRKLVEPSLIICNEGFHMTRHQYMSLKNRWSIMKNNSLWLSTFGNASTGEVHPIGTKLKPPKQLCETYKMIADNGPLDFYYGKLAKLIIEDLKEMGSIITAYDLESYFTDLVSSITMQLGDNVLHAMPPVSSGSIVAHVLSILEGYNITKADFAGDKHEALTVHRFVEAFKFAFAKRNELGDVHFTDLRELVSQLTNPEYGKAQRALINDSTVLSDIQAYGIQVYGNEDTGTSHVSVLAPNGDAVSVTSSINTYFGSGLIGSRTGIIFNSGMGDFSLKESYFNLPQSSSNIIEPRKRPMSSQSPMILTYQNGDVRMVIGAAGGPKIINGIVEVMARLLWLGQNIKQAIDSPRFYHQLLPNKLEYEAGIFNETILELLRQKGHILKPLEDIGSVVNAIVRNKTAIYANADYRKCGGIAGF